MKNKKVRFVIKIKHFKLMRIRFTKAVKAFAFALAFTAPTALVEGRSDGSQTEGHKIDRTIVASCVIND